ncbi:MAG TPA: hypothetical protein GX528_01545 [Firmicutes bacterium]|nr:hypothetical protein [Bacillota bacterium]
MAKRFVTTTAIIILVLLTANTVLAARILAVPTADLKAEGVGVFEYAYTRGSSRFAVNWGLLPRLNLSLGGDGGRFFAGFKVGILAEGADPFGLALGGEVGAERSEFYGVLSKQLGETPGLRGHFALGTGKYKRGLAGVSFTLNPVRLKTERGLTLPAASVLAAYDGSGFTAGVGAVFSPDVKAYVALEDFRSLGLGVALAF